MKWKQNNYFVIKCVCVSTVHRRIKMFCIMKNCCCYFIDVADAILIIIWWQINCEFGPNIIINYLYTLKTLLFVCNWLIACNFNEVNITRKKRKIHKCFYSLIGLIQQSYMAQLVAIEPLSSRIIKNFNWNHCTFGNHINFKLLLFINTTYFSYLTSYQIQKYLVLSFPLFERLLIHISIKKNYHKI